MTTMRFYFRRACESSTLGVDDKERLQEEYATEERLAGTALSVFREQLKAYKVTQPSEGLFDFDSFNENISSIAQASGKIGESARGRRVEELANNVDQFVLLDEEASARRGRRRRGGRRAASEDFEEPQASPRRPRRVKPSKEQDDRYLYPLEVDAGSMKRDVQRQQYLKGLFKTINAHLAGKGPEVERKHKNFVVDCLYPLVPDEFIGRAGEEVKKWVDEYRVADAAEKEAAEKEREAERIEVQEAKRVAAERRAAAREKRATKRVLEDDEEDDGPEAGPSSGHQTRGAKAARTGKRGTAAGKKPPTSAIRTTAKGKEKAGEDGAKKKKKKKVNRYWPKGLSSDSEDVLPSPESEEGGNDEGTGRGGGAPGNGEDFFANIELGDGATAAEGAA